MLIGNFESKLTENRRIAVPKIFRHKIGNKFIVARWYENCLVLIGKDKWEELVTKLTGKSDILTAPVRDTDRFILGSAFEVEADTQGRIVLPENLVLYAGLSHKVVFLGLGNRVEIWDKNAWQKRESFVAQNAAQILEKIAKSEQRSN